MTPNSTIIRIAEGLEAAGDGKIATILRELVEERSTQITPLDPFLEPIDLNRLMDALQDELDGSTEDDDIMVSRKLIEDALATIQHVEHQRLQTNTGEIPIEETF